MKIIILSTLLAAINCPILISPLSIGIHNGICSPLFDNASNNGESGGLMEDRLYWGEKKSALGLANLIATHPQEEAYEMEIIERTDTCKVTAILEAVVNVAYDTIFYQWYFEGNVIHETTPSIQVDQPGAYAVDISTSLNGYAQVTQQTFVVELQELKIEEVAINNTSCNESNGSLQVKVNSETGIQYSINGGNFQEENFFKNLAAGTYTVTVQDSLNCRDSQKVVIESSSLLIIEEMESIPATCGEENGSLVYEISGGTGQVFASINGDAVEVNNSFENLAKGEYIVTFLDEAGCTLTSKMSVLEAKCPIYIPNVFSPNNDGVNDLFQIVAEAGFNAKINRYLIFDRWGGQLYEAHNFFIHSSNQWWDGTFKNKAVGVGTYLYFIEFEFENGGKQILQGAVNILK